jgi:hypothetical protein
MTSYVVEKARCHRCNEVFIHAVTASHNTINAVQYTDGYIVGPTYDPGSKLLICPHCGVFAWRDSFAYVQSEWDTDSYEDNAESGLPWSRRVTGAVYQGALEALIARTPDEEIYLRMRVWWHGNDRRRRDPYWRPEPEAEVPEPLTEDELRNLRRLLELLPCVEAHDRILRAEASRELGDFDGCLAELAGIDSKSSRHAVEVIANLARAKRPHVARITQGKE